MCAQRSLPCCHENESLSVVDALLSFDLFISLPYHLSPARLIRSTNNRTTVNRTPYRARSVLEVYNR